MSQLPISPDRRGAEKAFAEMTEASRTAMPSASESHREIAKTILQQLGGGRFVAMTGARNLVASHNGLSFALPGGGGFCRDGINGVCVVLTPADLYDVEFVRRRGAMVKTVKKVEGIFFDQLREVFERATGLRTSL